MDHRSKFLNKLNSHILAASSSTKTEQLSHIIIISHLVIANHNLLRSSTQANIRRLRRLIYEKSIQLLGQIQETSESSIKQVAADWLNQVKTVYAVYKDD
jgi:hypothetical protein